MTMHMESQVERPADNAPPAGPGAQLRQARLDLKLAPEDVAHILHLAARQIVALENDDFDALPGPTYVRGYLRGYAQLLGLSPDPVIDAYNRLVASRRPVDLGKLAPRPEIRSDHQLIKFATLAVIVIVLGLSAVWYHEQDRPAVHAPAVAEPKPESEAPSETDTATMPTPPPAPEVTPPRPAAPVPAPTPTKPPAAAVEKPAPVVPAPTPVAPAVAGPRGQLVLRMQVESWADVRDAAGNKLLYEVIAPGRTVTVEGPTPLSVFLGNAKGVDVQFNGEAFDVSRFKRGDIARFTLGNGNTP
jgi:cytoskeleton protein RodZ